MPITLNGETFYYTQEAAQILNLNPFTILRWIRSKRLTGNKVGKGYVIAEESILEVLRGRQQALSRELTLSQR